MFGFWKPKVMVVVQKGGRGRWRWQAYRPPVQRVMCMSGIRGFGTRGEAERAAVGALRGYRVEIVEDRELDEEA